MEQTWEIIGIGFAVLMVIIGLRLLLKKPEPLPAVNSDDLVIEPDSQEPIVPRAVREQLSAKLSNASLASAAADTVENKPVADVLVEKKLDSVEHVEAVEKSPISTTSLQEIEEALKQEEALVAEAKQLIAKDDISLNQADAQEITQNGNRYDVENDVKDDIKLKQDIVSLDIKALEFADEDLLHEATVLDAHLSEQNRVDEESALATAQKIVALYMYPNPERALSGERTLKMLLKYGLRFGEMSCFHRYEHPEHPSSLMFSVLRIDNDGAPTGFDLEALPTDEVKGLAFFLALPSPTAVQGFDMMASIAGLIARDTEGLVFDEQSLELTQQLREHWRHFVIEYDPEQAKHLD